MKPEQQRIAIAELRGWRLRDGGMWYTPNGCTVGEELIPNYPNDLNAMHEIETSLNNAMKWDYLAELHEVMKTYHTAELFFASAAQRAEAFLRMKGKWRD